LLNRGCSGVKMGLPYVGCMDIQPHGLETFSVSSDFFTTEGQHGD